MSDDRIVISSGSALSPEAITNRSFAQSFRGFDQAEVKVFLKRVADELAGAAQRESQLRESLQDALTRAAHPELDEAVLTAALGERTARLLTNARETAAAMVSDAEARAARMLQEGEGRIARMRAEAETLLARRAEEAERLAGGLRQAADSDARSIRDRARADAQAEIEAARAQGREMVAEAKELRERMLSDLLRRRRTAESQIEQLRLAHQRLLEAYGVVRRTLDEATGELSAAEEETRPALEAVISRSEAQHGYGRAPGEESPRRPGGPPEREAQGPLGRSMMAPQFNPAPLPDASPSPSAEPDESADAPPAAAAEDEAGDARATPVEEPPAGADADAPAGPEATSATREVRAQPQPERPSASAAARPPGADDRGGVGALGAGTAPRPDPPSDPRPDPRPSGTREGRGAESRLSPVDIAAPGEEVRVVREGVEEPAGAEAAEPEAAPTGDDAESNGGPAPSGRAPGRSSRRQRRSRQPAEPSSGHVEELFARLRDAQQRRDAVEAATSPAAEGDLAPAQEPAAEPGGPSEPEPQGRHLTDEKALFRRDELLDPIDTDLTRRLKRVLQDEQNQVLDRLRRQRRPVPEATLPDLVDQTERYRAAAAPLLEQAAQHGASFAADAVGVPAVGSKAGEAIDGWAAELAIELITPLRERLERAIQDAGADEDADATVGERLSASYRQWKLQHIEQVARHYSSAAFTRGAFAAIADGTSLRWIVDDDGPCPDCEDNALAGPTPKGQSFPTGQAHPPAHPGCRCLLVPSVP